MAKKNTYSHAGVAIMASLLLVTGLLLSVGTTQARYTNTAVWNTLISPPPAAAAPQTPVLDGESIVDLGLLPAGDTAVRFTLSQAVTDELTVVEETEGLTATLTHAEGTYTLTVTNTATAFGESLLSLMAGQSTVGRFRCLTAPAEGEANTGEDEGAQPTLALTAPESLPTDTLLEITLSASAGIDYTALTLGAGFPAMTAYTAAGEQRRLWSGGKIWLPAAVTAVQVALPGSNLSGRLPVTATAYAMGAPVTETAADVVLATELDAVIWDPSLGGLSVALADDRTALTVEASATLLTPQGHQAADVFRVAVTPQAFTVTPKDDKPTAGTYALVISWRDGDSLCYQSEMTVFIHYSENVTAGGAK